MSSEDSSIAINFGKPIPLFPLDQVTLLPQQILPLHIFEPRYRQMIESALDGAGQIAMAVFDGDDWKQQYHGRPKIRRAVCIGHILRHEKQPDGRFNVLLQGVCRAQIVKETPARDGCLYREAMMSPLVEDASELNDQAASSLAEFRLRLGEMLEEGELSRLTAAEPLMQYIRNDSLPTQAVMEIVSFTLIQGADLRYRLLAERSAEVRAVLLMTELQHLGTMIRRASRQRPEDWPKGLSWN